MDEEIIRNSHKRKQAQRENILEVALNEFMNLGFVESSISGIAKSAGVADGTIYRYFKSKDDLFLQVLERSVTAVINQLEHRLSNIAHPLERILKFFDINVEIFISNPLLSRMIIVDVHQVKSFSLTTKDYKAYSNYKNYIKSLCADAIDKGFIRQIDADAATDLVFACIDYLIRVWVHSGHTINVHQLKESFLNMLVYGLIQY